MKATETNKLKQQLDKNDDLCSIDKEKEQECNIIHYPIHAHWCNG